MFDPRSDILKYRSSAEPCLSIRSCISPPGVMGVTSSLLGARRPTVRFRLVCKEDNTRSSLTMRLIRQLRSALLGAAILAAALLGAVAPASAHDAAESTSPAAGATVAAPPETGVGHVQQEPAGARFADAGERCRRRQLGGRRGGDRGQRRLAEAQVRAPRPAPTPWCGGWSVRTRTRSRAASRSRPPPAAAGSTAAAAVPTMGTAQPGTTPAPSPPADSSEPFPVEHRDLRWHGDRHRGRPGPDGQAPPHTRTIRQRHRRAERNAASGRLTGRS